MKNFLLIVIAIGSLVTSCTVNSHVMLKTPKDFVFDEIPKEQNLEYVISEGDQLDFKLYSNGGFAVIDIASGTAGAAGANVAQRTLSVNYLVEPTGKAKLPILGEIYLKGKTIRQAQDYLEELYAEFYVDPFLQLNVKNKRVIVFAGTGSNASVVTLNNNTVTLLEVLAQVGGITSNSKAKSIKVMRVIEGKETREVYKVDLSTIDGLVAGDLIVQADDIIYVEPNANIAREILQDITPIISLVTSSVLLYVTIKSLPNR
jgi:polysaccharide export outer membrane protein